MYKGTCTLPSRVLYVPVVFGDNYQTVQTASGGSTVGRRVTATILPAVTGLPGNVYVYRDGSAHAVRRVSVKRAITGYNQYLKVSPWGLVKYTGRSC